MAYLIARLREPSTYAGLAGLAAAFGFAVPAHWGQVAAGLGVALGGVLAVVMPEAQQK